jgi:hypothetical protein
VLLEVVLAIAIFVMAGTAILVLEDGSLSGLSRTRDVERARDLACSAMARLESGLDTARTLSGPVKPEKGIATPPGEWDLKIESEPSQFSGLTHVTVTARKLAGGGDEVAAASYTLHQLVRLADPVADRPGDDDPLATVIATPAAGAQP